MSIRRRDIIDVQELKPLLDEAAKDGDRAEIVGLLRAAHDRGSDHIRQALVDRKINGTKQAESQAYLADRILQLLHHVAVNHMFRLGSSTEAERLAVIAVGGFGRGELSPRSDVDLLFLIPYKRTGWCEQVTEFMLYALWDMGLKIGYSVRTPSDCVRKAAEDISICTTLLETRLLAGDEGLYEAMQHGLETDVLSGTGQAYLAARLEERDKRHARFGDSRYVVEPDLKEGKGGLRDLHTLFWIVKYLYRVEKRQDMVAEGILREDEMRAFRRAYGFFLYVRAHLHYLTGRTEDRLTFDVQPEMAQRLGYRDTAGMLAVERFMKHYFLNTKRVGDLTRIVCAVLEQRQQKPPVFSVRRWIPGRAIQGFLVQNERLNVAPAEDLAARPDRMVHIFNVAREAGLDIHPEALRRITPALKYLGPATRRDTAANDAFLSLLTTKDRPEIHLTRMNEAGVLGRFIPDFGKIVAMMQFDMYHHYTVDAHTIRAIGLLASVERGQLADDHPLSTKIMTNITEESRRALYVAVLCHDIAKGRKGDHSLLGEQVALKLAPRLGLNDQESRMAAWLVRWHLLLSHYALKRDLTDPQTLEEFVGQVAGLERLKLLTVLTVVDIRAVGPDTWNNWKAQLIRDLFDLAEERLRLGHASRGRELRVAERKSGLRNRLHDVPEPQVTDFLSRFGDSYWIAEDLDIIEANARLILAHSHRSACALWVDSDQDLARASVATPDRRGLFADLAGAFAASGAMVVDAKLHTTRDGWALDNFVVQTLDQQAFDQPARLSALQHALEQAAQGRHQAAEGIKQRGFGGRRQRRARFFQVPPEVFLDQAVSDRSTVIEVNARDRLGLLYDLAQALRDAELTVLSAHITTYGERAVDTFYLTDKDGSKIKNMAQLDRIKTLLLAAAAGTDRRAAA